MKNQSGGGHSHKAEESDFEDKVIHINRCAKVVKGGRRFSFAAIVVVGDKKGQVGVGLGKAGEVPEAIKKRGNKLRKISCEFLLKEVRFHMKCWDILELAKFF